MSLLNPEAGLTDLAQDVSEIGYPQLNEKSAAAGAGRGGLTVAQQGAWARTSARRGLVLVGHPESFGQEPTGRTGSRPVAVPAACRIAVRPTTAIMRFIMVG